ncbi:MAG: type II toxin-antitoxin system VapC family toxin [Acidimicrobiia bacterium]
MGLTHLDAGVIIGFLDANDAHHPQARDALTTALRAGDRLAMAASAYAECLVGPARRGDTAITTVRHLIERLPIDIIALDHDIAEQAARLRATHPSLRLPDALVIATAINHHADQLITTDQKWPTPTQLGLHTTQLIPPTER